MLFLKFGREGRPELCGVAPQRVGWESLSDACAWPTIWADPVGCFAPQNTKYARSPVRLELAGQVRAPARTCLRWFYSKTTG